MAIGNAPWPIGVTMVGIHARTGREKIFSKHVAHVLNDETQRKYIQVSRSDTSLPVWARLKLLNQSSVPLREAVPNCKVMVQKENFSLFLIWLTAVSIMLWNKTICLLPFDLKVITLQKCFWPFCCLLFAFAVVADTLLVHVECTYPPLLCRVWRS